MTAVTAAMDQWQVRADCAWVELDDGQAAILPFSTSDPIVLSPVATVIWSVLVEDRSPDDLLADPPLPCLSSEQIIREVLARVRGDHASVSQGVTDFLGKLAKLQVISHRPPERHDPHHPWPDEATPYAQGCRFARREGPPGPDSPH